jgi:hypothetical protein
MTFFTASVIGIIGSGLFILISYDTFRKRKKVDYRPFLPYAGMCVHAMLLALMVGLGRMGEKWWLALSPRYVGFSVWFWVGLVTLVWLKFDITSKLEHFDVIDRFWRKYTTYFIHTVIILSLICSLIGLGLGIYIRYIPVYMVRKALVSGNTSEDIIVQIYPDPTYLRSQLEVLKEYHLSFYR